MLQLKRILEKHGVKLSEYAAALQQTNGKAFGPAAVSRLLNHGEWPKATPKKDLEEQTELFLKSRQVPDGEIKTVWTAVDSGPNLTTWTAPIPSRDGPSTNLILETVMDNQKHISFEARRHFGGIRSA
ncbi:MAG: hypothetical protein GY862_17315 [Gammaproteobacteria bacterium]|nr:hypothetical protein [Gammaproteobacteria bacterium]